MYAVAVTVLCAVLIVGIVISHKRHTDALNTIKAELQKLKGDVTK